MRCDLADTHGAINLGSRPQHPKNGVSTTHKVRPRPPPPGRASGRKGWGRQYDARVNNEERGSVSVSAGACVLAAHGSRLTAHGSRLTNDDIWRVNEVMLGDELSLAFQKGASASVRRRRGRWG